MKEQYAVFVIGDSGEYEQRTIWLPLEEAIENRERRGKGTIFKQVWDIEHERQLCSKALTDVQQS